MQKAVSFSVLKEKWNRHLKKDKFACGVFLDFQKTFDTVNHNILIAKLNHYEIRGITLDWFQSYLTNRKQQTSISNTLSNGTIISYGVLQGSVLGPLLFLININALNEVISDSLIHHFADDRKILFSNKSLKNINKYINHDLAQIVQWLRANRVSLNSNKT